MVDVYFKDYFNVVVVKNMGDKLKMVIDGWLEIKIFSGGVLGDEK